MSEQSSSTVEAKLPVLRPRRRWVYRLLYMALVILLLAATLPGAEFAVGLVLAPLRFPVTGLCIPPHNTQTIAFHDFTYTVEGNAFGMRDADIVPPQPDTYRIAAIGDSYTFGWGVALEESWGKRLQHYLREDGLQVEVLNVGQPGVGPWEYTTHAEMALNELAPDMLLIELLQGNDLMQARPNPMAQFFPNIVRYMEERDAPPPPDYIAPSVQPSEEYRAWLVGIAQEILDSFDPEARARYEKLDDEVKTLFREGRINPWMIGEATNAGTMFEQFLNGDIVHLDAHVDTLAHLLRRMKRLAVAQDATVVTVSLPNGVFDNRPLLARLGRLGYTLDPQLLTTDAPDRLVQEAATRAGVPCYVVTDAFRQRSDDPTLYFELDHHMTAQGHDLFARSIAPYVAAEIRTQLQATSHGA